MHKYKKIDNKEGILKGQLLKLVVITEKRKRSIKTLRSKPNMQMHKTRFSIRHSATIISC